MRKPLALSMRNSEDPGHRTPIMQGGGRKQDHAVSTLELMDTGDSDSVDILDSANAFFPSVHYFVL